MEIVIKGHCEEIFIPRNVRKYLFCRKGVEMISIFGFGLVNGIFHGKSVPKAVKIESESAKGKKTIWGGGGKIEQIPRKV